jgi:hypothetical protein
VLDVNTIRAACTEKAGRHAKPADLGLPAAVSGPG